MGQRRFRPLFLLLTLTMIVETFAVWSYFTQAHFVQVYHVFVVLEYALLSWYFLYLAMPAYKIWIKISIPLFAAISICLSYFLHTFKTDFPGTNINVSGMLISVNCTYVLFNL